MAYRRPAQLPHDLIAVIAAAVASNPKDYTRTQTLADCVLVCRSFAQEFRRHLYETFTIRETLLDDAEDTGSKLCAHAQALEDHPEYRKLVKNVTLWLTNQPMHRVSILDDPRFPSWLKGLTSVISVSLGSSNFDEQLDFALIAPSSQKAITQLYTLPSIRRLIFEDIDGLPPRLFCDAPHVEYLSLGSVYMDDSASFWHQSLTEDDLKLLASTKPPVHLRLYNIGQDDVAGTLQALIPIIDRVRKLSGRYDATGVFSACLVKGRETVRELELTLSDPYDRGELDAPTAIISSATQIRRLNLKFIRSLSKSPSGSEPNLSAVLDMISAPFSAVGHSKLGVLGALSTITIEMHDIPARCLREEGIKNDQEMWDHLDGVLSKEQGVVPNLEKMELKLFLRWGEPMPDDEIQMSILSLLPSLTPSVRSITICLD
ncbi:hypothetical protein BKA70DRAFT_735325 [Coprinopsis sp. MPI-PUGE-AT-0042]|nr:hypothetical protein BKA70DRAFT_735325 [Coprinopsis sp. MPI-PUGE-AT-0042]